MGLDSGSGETETERTAVGWAMLWFIIKVQCFVLRETEQNEATRTVDWGRKLFICKTDWDYFTTADLSQV